MSHSVSLTRSFTHRVRMDSALHPPCSLLSLMYQKLSSSSPIPIPITRSRSLIDHPLILLTLAHPSFGSTHTSAVHSRSVHLSVQAITIPTPAYPYTHRVLVRSHSQLIVRSYSHLLISAYPTSNPHISQKVSVSLSLRLTVRQASLLSQGHLRALL